MPNPPFSFCWMKHLPVLPLKLASYKSLAQKIQWLSASSPLETMARQMGAAKRKQENQTAPPCGCSISPREKGPSGQRDRFLLQIKGIILSYNWYHQIRYQGKNPLWIPSSLISSEWNWDIFPCISKMKTPVSCNKQLTGFFPNKMPFVRIYKSSLTNIFP